MMQNKPPKGQVLRYVPPAKRGGPPRFKGPGEYRPGRARPVRKPFSTTTKKALEYGKSRVGRAVLPVMEEVAETVAPKMMRDGLRYGAARYAVGRAIPWVGTALLAYELYDFYREWTRTADQPARYVLPVGWTACPTSCGEDHEVWHHQFNVCDPVFACGSPATGPFVGLPSPETGGPYKVISYGPEIPALPGRRLYQQSWYWPLATTNNPMPEWVPPIPGFTIPMPDAEPDVVGSDPVQFPEPELSPTLRTLERLIDAIGPSAGNIGKIVVDADGHVDGKPSLQLAVALPHADLVPVGTDVIIKTNARQQAGRHAGGARLKKHKWGRDGRTWGSAPIYGLLKAYHAATEVSDALDVFANAIPGKPCSKLPGVAKAQCVLQHLGDIEWSEVPAGLVYDHYEDKIVGAFNRQLQKKGLPSTFQFSEFGRQLNRLGASAVQQGKPGGVEQSIREFLMADL